MSEEFKRWFALYFIEKGNWKLTDKAIEEFGKDEIPKQTMEFAEHYSSREREERTEYRVGLTAKEKKKIAYMKVADMIDKGKAEELYDGGYIVSGKLSWKDKKDRITAVKKFVEMFKKNPKDVTAKDFEKNKLSGLIHVRYNGSPYAAIKEAFPELNIKPWEMTKTPKKFFDKKENRVTVVKWLVEKLGKKPPDLIQKDFEKNKLRRLSAFYNGSLYDAVREAFPELNIKPWEMATTPMGFYEKKENRIAAVKWLLEKLKKDPRDLTVEDFYSNRLVGLLNRYYKSSPYEAVKEAFPEMGIKQWEMVATPHGFYKNKENRVATIRWLGSKIRKNPKDIVAKDFFESGLMSLLHYYNNSPYDAMKEAGLVSKSDEDYMRKRHGTGFLAVPSSKEVLEAAKKIERKAEKSDRQVRGKPGTRQKNSL